jgi:hypothetical protein
MDLKKINSNIKLIAGNYAKVNALVQTTAVAIIEHSMQHGDCTPALRLVQAMPKSARRGLLINWFAKYSPIGMNVNSGKVGLHRPEAKLYRPYDLEGAKANNWFEGAEANNENLPDTTLEEANKMIFAVAKKLQKKLDDGSVPATDRQAVEARIAALTALGRAAVKMTKQNNEGKAAAPAKAAA